MGDLAAWGCWAVHLRTPALDVGVLAVRRKYLPPAGDAYQDIFIVQTDDVEAREDPVAFEAQEDPLQPREAEQVRQETSPQRRRASRRCSIFDPKSHQRFLCCSETPVSASVC